VSGMVLAFLQAFLPATVRMATPLALAAVGECVVERSGLINIGLEGVILSGAFGALIGATAGGVAVGFLAGIASGVVIVIIFGIFTITLFFIHYPAGTFSVGTFKAAPFFGQFGVVAGYQISWAIYVSDYSRYMPPNVTVRRTFQWTYWGSAIGGGWMMILGAVLAAWAGKNFDGTGIAELNAVGDHVFDGFGAVVLVVAAIGLASVTALNMYGGSLTLISAVDSFWKVRPTLSIRVITVGLTAALSLIGALAASKHFLSNFNSFLLLILYLFIPWTAVNLVDYYIVRRGHYAIAEIFNPHGMYGRWGWRGILAYLVGFAAMVPFFNVGTLYEGPAAKALGGADISFFIGLPVAAILYYVFSRSIDVAAETRVAQAEMDELEAAAAEHELP